MKIIARKNACAEPGFPHLITKISPLYDAGVFTFAVAYEAEVRAEFVKYDLPIPEEFQKSAEDQ